MKETQLKKFSIVMEGGGMRGFGGLMNGMGGKVARGAMHGFGRKKRLK